ERPPSTFSVVNLFNATDERHGVKVGRRDRLLRTLVRNLYSYHLQEIFYTLANEYTDWTRPFLHPISLFDSLVDIFSDALVVAPVIRVGLLHSFRGGGNSGSNGGGGHGGFHQVAHHAQAGTYFYAFAHQTELGDYNLRLSEAVCGQELAYLFGAPLINGYQLSAAFPLNYTRAEVVFSEAFIRLVANFVWTGNGYLAVNKGSYPGAVISEENFFWPPYEEVQQKYASFGNKMTTGNHYLAHRLSYWFNLLPQQHKPGFGAEHHLLDSHNNPLNYEGVVCSGALSAPIAFDTYFSTEGGLMDQLLESSSNIVGGNSSSLVDGNHHHHQAFSVSSSTFNQNRKLGDLNSSSSSSSSFSSDGHGGRPGGDSSGGEGNVSFSLIVQSGN
ncbi:postsynaptic membrane assembly, partial [Tyrophagus putrescentiae]